MSEKVLEFGVATSKSYWPDREIVVREMKGEWWWIDKSEKYWAVFAFYAATKIPFDIEQQIMDNWSNALVDGGTLHIIVPSFEYLCRMGLQDSMEPWVKAMLLNAANHYTMKQLRIMMNRSGMKVLKAKTGVGEIELAPGMQVVLEQHYVAAINEDT